MDSSTLTAYLGVTSVLGAAFVWTENRIRTSRTTALEALKTEYELRAALGMDLRSVRVRLEVLDAQRAGGPANVKDGGRADGIASKVGALVALGVAIGVPLLVDRTGPWWQGLVLALVPATFAVRAGMYSREARANVKALEQVERDFKETADLIESG
jgi:hypothetical protein